MIDGQTNRTHFYISTQQPGLVCAIDVSPNETLGVQGEGVRPRPDSFWSYYPGDVGILSKVCLYTWTIKKRSYNLVRFSINIFFRNQLVGNPNILA